MGVRGGGQGGVVGLNDGGDDRQAETVAIALAVSVGCEPLEGLEESLDLVFGDDWSAVGDGQGRVRAAGLRSDFHVPVGMVMADGVVDEVGHEAFDQSRVPGCHRGCEVFGEVDACVWPGRGVRRALL